MCIYIYIYVAILYRIHVCVYIYMYVYTYVYIEVRRGGSKAQAFAITKATTSNRDLTFNSELSDRSTLTPREAPAL